MKSYIFYKLILKTICIWPFFAKTDSKVINPQEFISKNHWILICLQDYPFKKEDFKRGIPYLEFQANNNRVSGFTGCNRLNAIFTIKNNNIAIKNIVTTRMRCIGIDIEDSFVTAITTPNLTYKVQQNKLLFFKDKKILLIFEKQ